eukprot:2863465-Amphidinium_carterae.1
MNIPGGKKLGLRMVVASNWRADKCLAARAGAILLTAKSQLASVQSPPNSRHALVVARICHDLTPSCAALLAGTSLPLFAISLACDSLLCQALDGTQNSCVE